MRSFTIVSIWAAVSLWGQVVTLPGPPPLKMPGWLAPIPQARDLSHKTTPDEALSSYTVSIPAADVISHYERQLESAGIAPDTKRSGPTTTIEAATDQGYATVLVREENGAVRVEVSYKTGPRPETPPAPVLTELLLEWPAWLEVPNGRLISQRTNPRGRVPTWSIESCPGDVISQPSHGCLKKEYQTSRPLREVYDYLVFLLNRYGYTTDNVSGGQYAELQLWKWITEPIAQMRMRQYPERAEFTYYRQLDIALNASQAGTKVDVTFSVSNPSGVRPLGSVAGAWAFTHFNDRFRGTIVLAQFGTAITGTWHTSYGKVEPDDPLAGRLEGTKLYLRRTFGNLHQDYTLDVSADGSRMDGYGDGWFLNHTNLNMQRIPSR